MLELTDLSVQFENVIALDSISLDVAPGELVGLIGPNGAGKTTLVDAVSGFVPHGGRVVFDGVDISRQPAHRRAKEGVSRTWQSVGAFGDLTVQSNCGVGHHESSRNVLTDMVVGGRRRATPQSVLDALDECGLAEMADDMPSELSAGRLRLMAVARALASEPRCVLFDEPAAGLDRMESEALGVLLSSAVRERQCAAVLIEHDAELVFGICDRVVVLDRGSILAEGAPDDVRSSPAVIEAYLGGSAIAAGPEAP